MGTLMWEAFRTNPAAVPAPEMAAAFQTGLIDVGATVPVFYVASGLNKVAPVMTRAELFFVPSFNLMNRASWDRLSPEQQAAIERARQRTGAAMQRREVREFQMQMRQAHVKGGGQLVDLDAGQRDAYRRLLEPVWPRMVAEAGPGWPGLLRRDGRQPQGLREVAWPHCRPQPHGTPQPRCGGCSRPGTARSGASRSRPGRPWHWY